MDVVSRFARSLLFATWIGAKQRSQSSAALVLLPTNLTSSESKRELARLTEKRDIPKGNGVKRVRSNEVA